MSTNNSFLEILNVITRTGIHHRLSGVIISSSKIWKNYLWQSFFLIKHKTFVIAAPKTLENIQKNTCKWSSLLIKFHDHILKLTTGLKTPLQILFWKCQERKRCSKIPTTSKKPLQNGHFSLSLRAYISEFIAK